MTLNIPLAARIDATRLTFAPDADPLQVIDALCTEALQYGFRAVCVRPQHVRRAAHNLKGHAIHVATVIGFPTEKSTVTAQKAQVTLGHQAIEEKQAEIQRAVTDGATELDIVMNVARFWAGDVQEFEALKQCAGSVPIKWIIETDLLTNEQVRHAAECCARAQLAYVKTSTGMLSDGLGATVEVVRFIKNVLENLSFSHSTGIKASGGIRTAEQANARVQAGADILGCSNGPALMVGIYKPT